MSLVRYCQPQDALREFFSDSVFSSVFPALDVAEDAQQYVITADLPGLTREQIKVSLEEGVLTIEGERASQAVQQERKYHRLERSYGKFARSLNLGYDINAEAIKASYKDGVLEVSVPKAERAKPKAIDISVG